MLYFINNSGDFLKAAPHLRTFASHRLECDVYVCFIRSIQYLIQAFSNSVNPEFRIHIRKCAGMKHDISYAQRVGTPNFFLQEVHGKLIRIRLIGT
ncbi:hypothetical protein D3C77_556510 [compost metagenome]